MKWGTKYSAEYVNILYRMVERNLTIPFQMTCFTDDETGIDSSIACLPIPKLNITESGKERMWKKITVFHKEIQSIRGTALFLDLDVVIVDNIDCFFEDNLPFKIIKDYNFHRKLVGNSSVFRFELGAHQEIVNYLEENFNQIEREFSNEQAFLSHYMQQKEMLNFWDKSWCPSYKYDCVSKIPFAFWKKPEIPDDAKIIIFHGEINPPKAIEGGRGKWYRYVRGADWIKDYWY